MEVFNQKIMISLCFLSIVLGHIMRSLLVFCSQAMVSMEFDFEFSYLASLNYLVFSIIRVMNMCIFSFHLFIFKNHNSLIFKVRPKLNYPSSVNFPNWTYLNWFLISLNPMFFFIIYSSFHRNIWSIKTAFSSLLNPKMS